VAEPDEPVSEIKGVCLLGLLAVVITPEERGGELTGELGMLKRLLAAGDLQEALGDRTASGTAFTGASDLERQQIGVFAKCSVWTSTEHAHSWTAEMCGPWSDPSRGRVQRRGETPISGKLEDTSEGTTLP
jgi:hypothetical protein